MWKGLSIFSGILLFATAVVNYLVMSQMQNEIKNKDDAYKNAQDSKSYVTQATKNLNDNKKELLADTELARQMNRDLIESKGKKEAAIKKLEADTKVLTDTKAKKAELDAELVKLGGLDIIVAELNRLGGKKTENEALIQQKEAAQALALQKKQQTESSIAALKKKDLMQKTGLMNDTFTGSITNIDSQWGFIMINKGNSSNVVKNAKLDVKRGSDVVATLVVTNVQPNASICDVVPGTLAAGQQLQAGDRVVVNQASSESKNIATPVEGAPATPAAPGAPAAPAAPAKDPFAPAAAPAAPDPFAPAPAAPAPAAAPGPEAAAPAPASN